MPWSRQIVRPGQKQSPAENPHDFVEHERLGGICNECGWYESDHYTLEALVALIRSWA